MNEQFTEEEIETADKYMERRSNSPIKIFKLKIK